jgi:hypothetical protein
MNKVKCIFHATYLFYDNDIFLDTVRFRVIKDYTVSKKWPGRL